MTRFLPLLIWITVIFTAAAEATLLPNTGAVLVADVAGTKVADDTFWGRSVQGHSPSDCSLYYRQDG